MNRPYLVGNLELPDAKERFSAAEKALAAAGMVPVNPTQHTYGPEDTWLDMMKDCLKDMAVCSGIATIDEDEDMSMENRVLLRLARDLGMPVSNVEAWVEFKGVFG